MFILFHPKKKTIILPVYNQPFSIIEVAALKYRMKRIRERPMLNSLVHISVVMGITLLFNVLLYGIIFAPIEQVIRLTKRTTQLWNETIIWLGSLFFLNTGSE